jgi:hypothetical protein
MVRVIDKKYKNGKYFTKKGSVIDVQNEYNCTLKMEDNSILDDICEYQVETTIPSVNEKIICVKGPNKGVIGVLMNKNQKNQNCLIKPLDDDDFINEKFDDVCKYLD